MFKKICSLVVISILSLGLLSGCGNDRQPAKPAVTLTYYKLFEDSAAFEDIINDYEALNPHITINYRKFADPTEYEDLLLNEFAEGEGPDIFSMPNTWIQANYRKISPGPETIIPASAFANTFVNVAWEDLVYPTGQNGEPQVYGLPLTIDTLALYYNQDHYERTLPEQGKPSTTWQGLTQDVLKLRRVNDNNILRAGIALGSGTSAPRTVDVFYALLQQYQVDIYNNKLTQANLTRDNNTNTILELITSFTDTSSSYYTWSDKFVAGPTSDIDKFAAGELSLLFGYAHLYSDIQDQITLRERNDQETIERTAVRVAPLPQLSQDPNDYIVPANYFAETVARTSQNSDEAWLFLRYLVNRNSVLNFYENGGFKPTARRDLIEEQRTNAIYRPFIEQIGYAESLPIADPLTYREIFSDMLTDINAGQSISQALSEAQITINNIIPATGIRLPAPPLP